MATKDTIEEGGVVRERFLTEEHMKIRGFGVSFKKAREGGRE